MMHATEFTPILLTGLAGMVLGALFFGGLWWTVQRGATSPRAALWFAASFLVRTTIAVGGLYLAGAGSWQRLAACLAGFLATRLIVVRLTGPVPVKAADAS